MRCDPLRAVVAVAMALALSSGCRPSPAPIRAPASTVEIGACADPRRDGVVGTQADFITADRDLNGDGVVEKVRADRSRCVDGNCFWNLFTTATSANCLVYLGTLAGAKIEQDTQLGHHGFHDLKSWWTLDGARALLHEYRMGARGYEISRVHTCREISDGQLMCAPDGDSARTHIRR